MSAAGCVHVVTPAEANDAITEHDFLILDVRTPEEYQAGHIEGAINLPVCDLNEASAKKTIGDPDRKVLVYCRAGVRSARASNELAQMGYKDVYDLAGGTDAWPFGLVK